MMPMSIHLKKGFAFMEVVISMAMLGIVLTSLFVATGSSMQRVLKTSLNLALILPLKHSFYLVMLDPSEEKKQTLPLPAYCNTGSIDYRQKKIETGSVFFRFTNLYLQDAATLPPQDPRNRMITQGLLICIPPKQKKQDVT